MVVWGVSCRIDDGEPLVVAVELSDAVPAETSRILLHRSNPSDDWAQKLRLLASDFDTQLRRASPDALIIRSMDWSRFRHEAPTRMRFQVEGVLLAVARRYVDRVEGRSGREIGTLCGSSKSAVEAEAARIAEGEDRDATAAALGALRLI